MHMVAARRSCQSAIGWDCVGQFLPWLHGQALKTLLSPCRGFISDMEGCLGPERVFDN